MATSPAQIRTAPIPLPALVPVEAAHAGDFERALPWGKAATLLAGDAAALMMAALAAWPLQVNGLARCLSLLPAVYGVLGLYSAVPKHPAEELRRIVAGTALAVLFAGN